MKNFATRHPILFGLLITLIFIVFVVFAIFIGQLFPGDYGREGGQAAGRIAGFLVFLILLNRLGWKKDAGLISPKGFKTWLIVLIPLAYSIIVFPLIFTGEWSLNFSDPIRSILTASNGISAGLLEEITFRGFVLYGFIRLWGNKKSGMNKSVVASSLIFGLLHLSNILSGAEVMRVLPQIAYSVLGGMALGAFVIYSRSIWPAAAFHCLSNAVVELNRMGKSIELTSLSAVLLGLAALPLALYGILLLQKAPKRDVVPDVP
jgi:membrane protease YdiL (CAAX protease family)